MPTQTSKHQKGYSKTDNILKLRMSSIELPLPWLFTMSWIRLFKEGEYQCRFKLIIQMLRLILLLASLHIVLNTTEPILQLPLTFTPHEHVHTYFGLGTSQVPALVDISSPVITVCCQNRITLFQTIYYFMLNPFHQSQNYICHSPLNKTVKTIATFPNIGPLTLHFNQSIYPQCTLGTLGFSKSASFLTLLPKSSPFFIIEKSSRAQSASSSWQLRVGGPVTSQYTHFQAVNSPLWTINVTNVGFNGVYLGSQLISLTTGPHLLQIPTKVYTVIKNELLSNFLCITRLGVIYCPCTLGISSSFPSFLLTTPNTTFLIRPNAYLQQQAQVCKALIVSVPAAYWSINVLMFDNVDLMFRYDTSSVSMAHHSKSITTNDSVTQPLQIILNSVVILLMCLFVAMILIEVVKHLTGIDEASSQTFQNYMMKRADE